MESEENDNLTIGAYIKRNDPRDVFISIKYKTLKELKKDSTVGSSSRRRSLQLKLINPNIIISNIRGNIDTRIKKLEEGKFDAIILAAAGVKSLNLEKKIKNFFSVIEMLPAAGQGVIAVQCRKNDDQIKDILKKINHEETMCCAIAEKEKFALLSAFKNNAVLENNLIKLKAQLFSDDGKKNFNYNVDGNKDKSLQIGQEAGKKILELAGEAFKK